VRVVDVWMLRRNAASLEGGVFVFVLLIGPAVDRSTYLLRRKTLYVSSRFRWRKK